MIHIGENGNRDKEWICAYHYDQWHADVLASSRTGFPARSKNFEENKNELRRCRPRTGNRHLWAGTATRHDSLRKRILRCNFNLRPNMPRIIAVSHIV